MEIINFNQYLEDLCRRHIDIRHDYDGLHFVDSESEKDTSLDSVLRYPAVILSKSTFQYTGDDIRFGKDREYMIFIVDHVDDTADYDQIRLKIDKCELILDELFNKMIEDKRSRIYRFLNAFSLAGIDVDRIENKDNSLYGVLAIFSLEVTHKAINCRTPFIK